MPETGELEHEVVPSEDTPAPPPPRSGSKLKLYGLLALIVLLLAAGIFWWTTRNEVSTDDAQVDGHITSISPKVPGPVLEVLAEIQQHVQAGQVLVRLDPRDYQTRVDQMKAALGVAEAQANAARVTVPLTRATTSSGISSSNAQVSAAESEHRRAQVAANQAQTSGVAAAQANVAQAEASARKAQADLERMRPLIAKQEISQQQFDAYEAAAQVAAAQLNNAQQQLNAAGQSAENAAAAVDSAAARVAQARAGLQESQANQQQVRVTAARAESANASIQQARANLAAAELDLSYTTIRAPVEGVISNKSVEPGQYVAAGQGLMTVVPLHDVWVIANFKETQLAGVRPGQRAEVKVDMYGRKITGRVDSISGATGARLSLLPPENATGNFVKVVQRIPVKIVFDSLPDGVVLRPGMNVDVTIFLK